MGCRQHGDDCDLCLATRSTWLTWRATRHGFEHLPFSNESHPDSGEDRHTLLFSCCHAVIPWTCWPCTISWVDVRMLQRVIRCAWWSRLARKSAPFPFDWYCCTSWVHFLICLLRKFRRFHYFSCFLLIVRCLNIGRDMGLSMFFVRNRWNKSEILPFQNELVVKLWTSVKDPRAVEIFCRINQTHSVCKYIQIITISMSADLTKVPKCKIMFKYSLTNSI